MKIITLVKGDYRPSSSDNLSISAVFVGRQSTMTPPCIIAEFTDSCQLQQVIFCDNRHTKKLTATHHPLGYLSQLPIDHLDVQLLFTCCPATVICKDFFASLQRRTLVVAVADLVDTIWHDGILAHVDRGKILSLVASVGKASLTVPLFPKSNRGIDPCQLPKLNQGDHAYACLAAIFSDQWSGSPPTLYLDQFDLCSMVCLAVASSLDVSGLNIVAEQKSLTKQWRRFLQNIGAQLHHSGKGVAVSQLAKFVSDAQLIAATINRHGAVIPTTMFASGRGNAPAPAEQA